MWSRVPMYSIVESNTIRAVQPVVQEAMIHVVRVYVDLSVISAYSSFLFSADIQTVCCLLHVYFPICLVFSLRPFPSSAFHAAVATAEASEREKRGAAKHVQGDRWTFPIRHLHGSQGRGNVNVFPPRAFAPPLLRALHCTKPQCWLQDIFCC